MGAVRLLAAFEMRRRWLSLIAVALMVALVVGVVAAALAGARRTSSSVERFRAWSHASDGSFQASSLDEAGSLRRLLATRADVVAVAERRLVNGFVENRPISDIALIADPEGRYGVDVDRPRVLSGRMPAADRPDEIALNELAARLARVRVGDVLQMKTWSVRDLESLFGGNGFPGFNGPHARMQVVGVVRTPDGLPGEIARTSPYGLASPAFLTKYRDVGAWPPAIYVRTANSAAFARLSAAVAATPSPGGEAPTYSAGTPVRTVYLDASQKAVNSASWALLAFAIAAAIAGAIVIGQAAFRYLSGAVSAEFLGELGMTRSGVAMACTVPIVVATLAGVALGMAGAVLASPLLPIGLARRAEIDPGIRVDPLVVLAGSAVTLVVVCVFAFVSARQAARGARETRLRRRPGADIGARRASLSPVVATGLRFARERRTGERTVPVRTAFAALAVAVAGVAAASVVASSFSRLETQPERWGWNWSSEPDYFGNDNVATLARRLVHDDRVSGVGVLETDSVLVSNVQTSGWAMKSYKGDMALTRRRGRLPSAATDIALGEATLDRTKTHIGDSVRVSAMDHTTRMFTVVGTAVFRSQSESPVLDDGVAFTPAGFESLVKHAKDTQASLELRYPADADGAAVEAALAKDYGFQFNAFTTPQVPGVVRRLAETRTVAIALAVFFAVLGVLALAHSLVVGIGGRRRQIGVLRTLGFRSRQVRAAIAVQATALALAATAIGLPVGIALGRWVWHALTGDLGALDGPATPWFFVAVAIPTTALCATALAAWPARVASRARIADALHVE
jgi:hypothetical protein